eukprot:754081-Pelagomonas_calceolata.AAC.1
MVRASDTGNRKNKSFKRSIPPVVRFSASSSLVIEGNRVGFTDSGLPTATLVKGHFLPALQHAHMAIQLVLQTQGCHLRFRAPLYPHHTNKQIASSPCLPSSSTAAQTKGRRQKDYVLA